MKRFFHNIKIEKIKNILAHLKRVFFATYKKRKRFFALVFISLVLLIGTGIYFQFAAKKAAAAWWNDAWSYRKKISITNPSAIAQTNFQVGITVNTKELIDKQKVQSNCGDLRITDSAGTVFPIWIEESGDNACNTASTLVWVKITTLSAAGMDTYVYYGNIAATTVSDGNSTFDFFDDFSANSGKWTTDSGSWNVTGGEGISSGPNTGFFTRTSSYNFSNGVIEARQKVVTGDWYQGIFFRYQDANNFYGMTTTSGYDRDYIVEKQAGVNAEIAYSFVHQGNSNYHRIKTVASSSIGFYKDGALVRMESGENPQAVSAFSSGKIALGGYDNSGQINTDWIFVRKYMAIDPITSLYTEEKKVTPVAYWKFDEGNGIVAHDSTKATNVVATGGTVQDINGYRVHTFNNDGTFTVNNGGNVEVLVVGGGGGGGSSITTGGGGGGGGAGGLIYNNAYSVASGQAISITVGTGGNPGGTNLNQFGVNGGNTIFGSLTAIGGGGGANYGSDGLAGGSGGGGGYNTYTTVHNGGVGTAGQGFSGGSTSLLAWAGGAGGGGAGGVGGDNKVSHVGGDRGPGLTYSISGSPVLYAQGGAGGANAPVASSANVGKGGDAAYAAGTAYAGGSGVVIVRYPIPSDATLTNMSTTFSATSGWQSEDNCVSGKCLAFDGIDDYVDGKINPALTSIGDGESLSYSVWFKTGDTTTADFPNIMGIRNIPNNQIFNLRLYNGDLQLEIYGASYANTITYTNAVDNKWHHAEAVKNGNNAYLYVDGKLIGSVSNPWGAISQSTSFLIGSRVGPAYFQGLIDEPKVYGYARTADQIKQDYNAGLAGASSANGSSTSFGVSSQKFMTDGLLGYWKMDEASWNGTTGEVKDASGKTNNGTAVNGALISTGKYGNGGSFDGINDGISVGTVSPATAVTFSSWLYINSTNPYNGTIFANWGAGGNAYYIGTLPGTPSTIQVFFNNAWIYDVTNVSVNSWVHLVVTNDGTTAATYIDGVLVKSQAATLITSTGVTGIGYDVGRTGYPFNGKIDEARIYNRALSRDEVLKLFEYAPSPVGYWKMDENTGTLANDSSGNGNAGTLTNGPTWAAGKSGSAVNFNGSNSYIDVPNSSSLNITGSSLSLSAWVNLKSCAGNNGFIHKNLQYTSAFYPSGSDCQITYADNSNWNYAMFGYYGTITKNVWHHISINKNSSNVVSIYVDGVLLISKSFGGAITQTTNPLRMGAYPEVSGYLDGLMDEVKVYNYARSPKQVLEDMNAGDPASKSPLGWWKFDEGTGGSINNLGSGGSLLNGSLFGVLIPAWSNSGKFGKALSFTGGTIGGYVQTPAQAINSSFTYTSWFKPTSAFTEWAAVVTNLYHTSPSSGLNIVPRNGSIKICYGDGSVAYQNYIVIAPEIVLNQWNYVAVSYDGTNIKLYVNGTLKDSRAATVLQASQVIRMGTWASSFAGDYFFTGLIDETKIFNYALSSSEISAEYNQNATVTMASQGISAGSPDNSAKAQYCIPGDASSCNAPTGEWKFDENTGTTVKDTSSNGYNGTLNGSTPTVDRWTVGKINAGGNFNFANTDYVATTLTTDPAAFTVSAWAKIDASDANFETVFSKFLGVPYRGFFLRKSSNASVLSGCVFNNGTPACVDGGIDFGKWTYWTMRFDGSTLYLYKNGMLAGSIAGTIQNSGTPFLIGANYIGSETWNGKIDQVTFYSYARTPAQIAYDYNRGKPIGWWKMDECQGSTLFDASGNGNNGTLIVGAAGSQTAIGTCETSGSAWANGKTGKYSSSLNFDGTDDYVNIAEPSNNSLDANTISVSAWVKLSSIGQQMSFLNKQGSTTDRSYIIYMEADNKPRMAASVNGTGFTAAIATTSLTTGQWYHITGTYDGANVKIFVNGKLENAVAMSGNIFNSAGGVQIGRIASPAYLQAGQIDDVRVYNYALTDQQVANVMNEGSALRFGQ
jgi:hypothetical protein